MKVTEEPFEWDGGNLAHLALHGITRDEAEEVVRNGPSFLGVEQRLGELRRRELGTTDEGRLLFIITVARGYKIRVVTGWQASGLVRRSWEQAEGRRNDES